MIEMDNNNIPQTVDQYIAAAEPQAQEIMQKLRAIIKELAPEAQESISYRMPAYKFHGVLVYFAAYKNHIGFYPASSGIENFQHKFADYKWSKGAVQFSLKKEIPYDLVRQIVEFRVKENLQKAEIKSQKKKKE